jgi:hypothetical protein
MEIAISLKIGFPYNFQQIFQPGFRGSYDIISENVYCTYITNIFYTETQY